VIARFRASIRPIGEDARDAQGRSGHLISDATAETIDLAVRAFTLVHGDAITV
jgi:hypothetical protein